MKAVESLSVSRLEDLPEWEDLCRKHGNKVVTIVRFVSLLSPNASPEDQEELAIRDAKAEEAAMQTGTLELYKKGVRDEEGVADNQCWWTDAADARNVVHSPDHIAATKFMIERALYQDFYIDIYDVNHTDDGQLQLSLSRTMTKESLESHTSPAYFTDENSAGHIV